MRPGDVAGCGRPLWVLKRVERRRGGPADASRINIHEEYEIAYWTKTLGCTPPELIACVNRVGPMVSKVKVCLGR